MRWGDTQNLLSVIIGLNIAYSAFKELRAPYLTELTREIEQLNEDILNKIQKPPPEIDIKALTSLLIDASGLGAELKVYAWSMASRRMDNMFGLPSMVVAIVGIALLIFSTIMFDERLSPWLFWMIVGLGFLPVIIHILLNYALVIAMQDRFGKAHAEMQQRYSDLVYRNPASALP
jgi:hypothetical protein